jgi:DNA-binding response OmpR family regulator
MMSFEFDNQTVHTMRNQLNTILGYAQILEEESLSGEQHRMVQSIVKATQNMRTNFLSQNEKTQPSPTHTFDKKLLIVDDDEDNRHILKLIAKKSSYHILEASTATEALNSAKNMQPELIFMDLHLQDKSGVEVAKQIKSFLPAVSIVAVSGDVEYLSNHLDDIFDTHLVKPIEKNEVKNLLAQYQAPNCLSLNNSTPKDKNRLNIAIIDDNVQNLTLFKEILTAANYNVDTYSCPKEALHKLPTQEVHLILLDIVMPVLNGYEVLKALRLHEALKDTPVIFLTAKDSPQDITKGLKAGATDYIIKPFHPQELKERIRAHLEKSRLFAHTKRLMEYSFHELYTPLSVISFSMQNQELEFGSTNYTTMTRAACKNIQTIYDDLYYSLHYQKQERTQEVFDGTLLLKERIEYFLLIAHSKNLTIKSTLVPTAPIKQNDQDMQRIFDNLLSNAIKYSKADTTIDVTIYEKENTYTIRFCNTTKHRVDIEKIFTKYYHEGDTIFGVGIGLDLVQNICEANDITLHAHQEDDYFCIELDIKKASYENTLA